MKMITAIINKKDADEVCRALSQAGFYFTKMASTGGFLTSGNITLIMGTEDEKVDAAIEIIRSHSSRRVETVSSMVQMASHSTIYPTEVTVGGATVFVTAAERFEKF